MTEYVSLGADNSFNQFRAEFSASAPDVTARAWERLRAHYTLLFDWNQRMNLVSRASFKNVFWNHYADAILASQFVNSNYPTGPVRDVGSGAGFPGLVFAALYPERDVVLFERMAKKRAFLQEAIATMELERVALKGAFGEGKFPKSNALFFARAVAPPGEIWKLLLRYMAPNAFFVLQTSDACEISLPRALVVTSCTYSLPRNLGDRCVTLLKCVPRGT